MKRVLQDIWVMTGQLYLQSTASGHGLICVQGGAQLFAEEFADSLFDGGDSGGTANNLHCIDIFFLQFWIQKGAGKNDGQQFKFRVTVSLCFLHVGHEQY